MPSQNLISLTSVSNVRLEHFRAQQELARNFYDDNEFCPLRIEEEATEHRERIQKRTSPQPSPTYSPYYYTQQHPYYHHHQQQLSRPTSTSSNSKSSNSSSSSSSSSSSNSTSSSTGNRAIPIIDPSNMTPVAVPSNGCTSPSMAQWPAYNNNLPTTISPSSSNSSIGSVSTSKSSTSNDSYLSNNNIHHIKNNYYFNNCAINYQYPIQPQPQKQVIPVVARAIPIVDPATRQVFRHQRHQNSNISPSFYNVSVC